MKTILPKNHKYKSYVGRNGIEIRDLDCLNYTCFSAQIETIPGQMEK